MLTALEIKKQEFSRAMRGYDPTEVRRFLDTVAAQTEKLSATMQTQTSEIERLQAENEAYRRMENTMKDALLNSQEMLRESRESARREAELTRREAEMEAERIMQTAHNVEEQIRRDIEHLGARREGFIRKLRVLLRSELELIDLLEKEETINNERTVTQK